MPQMHDLKTKTVVDERFEIIERLGVGGMGVVYKAEQVGLDRTVALKVLLPHLLADGNSLARFEIEAQALSTLKHRNISAFYAYGVWHGRAPYIAMEFLDTGDLQDLLIAEGGRLSWQRTVKIVRQICEGVAHAHNAGIFHRDIKPSNIFVLREGEEEIVKVGDFGLAKIVDEDGAQRQKLTATGVTVGSPLYMSPEQMRGAKVTAAGDIYSVGCVMYQCLFERPPFEAASTIDVFARHLEGDCPLPKEDDLKGAPPELLTVLETALAKDPAARYATMSEMANALLQIERKSEDLPDTKVTFTPQAPTARAVNTNSVRVITSVILLLLASLGFIMAFNVPLLRAMADQLSNSHSTQSLETALKVAGFFEQQGGYNQAAPFYDAALAISHELNDAPGGREDTFRTTKILLSQVEMFDRAGQPDSKQIALTQAMKYFLDALQSQSLQDQSKEIQRNFVVSSLMALSQWSPAQPDQARPFQSAPQYILDLGFRQESMLATAMWFVWGKPIEHHPTAVPGGALGLSVEMLELGPNWPHRTEEIALLEKVMGYKMKREPAEVKQLADDVVAAADAHRRSDAFHALLQLGFHYCLYDQSEQTTLQYLSALHAFQRSGMDRDDINVSYYFFRSLCDAIPTLSESAQIDFYTKALANETERASTDQSRHDIRRRYDWNLAQIYLNRHQPEKAIALYQASIYTAEHQPFKHDVPTLERFVFTCDLAIGRILMDQGKWKEALPYFEKVHRHPLKYVGTHPYRFACYGLANCVAHISGPEAAVKALHADTLLDQAVVYADIGRNDLASKVCETAFKTTTEPDMRAAMLTGMGCIYGTMNEEQKCLASLKQGVSGTEAETSLAPQDKAYRLAARRLEYGRALVRYGQRQEGEKQLLQGVQESRTLTKRADQMTVLRPLLYELGNFYLAQKDMAKADTYFDQCQQLYVGGEKSAADCHCACAGQALARNDLVSARREVRRALEEFYNSCSWPECDAMSWAARVDFALGAKARAKTWAATAYDNWIVCNRMSRKTALTSEYRATLDLCRILGVPTD